MPKGKKKSIFEMDYDELKLDYEAEMREWKLADLMYRAHQRHLEWKRNRITVLLNRITSFDPSDPMGKADVRELKELEEDIKREEDELYEERMKIQRLFRHILRKILLLHEMEKKKKKKGGKKGKKEKGKDKKKGKGKKKKGKKKS